MSRRLLIAFGLTAVAIVVIVWAGTNPSPLSGAIGVAILGAMLVGYVVWRMKRIQRIGERMAEKEGRTPTPRSDHWDPP